MRNFLRDSRISAAAFALLFGVYALPTQAASTVCATQDTSPEACQAVLTSTNNIAPTSDISKGAKLSATASNILFNSFPTLCRFLDNNSHTNDYFIPQANATEFAAVIQNLPANVAMGNCVFPVSALTSTFTATASIDYASFEIFAEGGPIVPTSPDKATVISNIAVPTQGGIMRVPQNDVPVSVINAASNTPIVFTYTRQDCLPAPNDTVCNTWTIKETQVQYYNAVPSSPPGNDGHWVWSRTVSTYAVNVTQGSTANWQSISSATADYRPPVLQSCTMNGTTYNSGTSWTAAVTSSQTPTAAECPFGAGTRLDQMSTNTHYTCNNGTANVTSTDTPTETGFTGSCASVPNSQLVYVSDSMNNRIEVFDSTGAFQFQFGTGGTSNGQFNQPWDIRIDSSKNLVVTDSGNHRVQKFDNAGNFLAQIGSQGTGLGKFDTPDNAQVNPITNQLWVTDEYLNGGMIDVFNSSGTALMQKGGFQHPTAVAFDGSGYTWISNSSTNTILQLDNNGNTLFQFGSSGSGNGQFNFVWSMAFDANGHLWAVDTFNNRVQVFDNAGKFLFKFGTAGSGPGQFNNPLAITIDGSGNVWITDQGNNRVEEFDGNGNYIMQFGSYGSAPGQFNNPAGITVSNPVAPPSNTNSCSVSGSTYASGQTWTTNVLSSKAPSANECPNGAGTLMDTMSTPTTYLCTNGSVSVQSTGTPMEIGYTGTCGNSNYVPAYGEITYYKITPMQDPNGYAGMAGAISLMTPQNAQGSQSFSSVLAQIQTQEESLSTPQGTYYVPGLTPAQTDWTGVCYDGGLQINTPGTYTFVGEADDGAALWIDGQLIFDYEDGNFNSGLTINEGVGASSPIIKGPSVTLSAGLHDVQISYYNGWQNYAGMNFWMLPQGVTFNANGCYDDYSTCAHPSSQYLMTLVAPPAGQTHCPGALKIPTSPPAAQTMYIVDMNNSRIETFDTNGNYKSQFGTNGSGNGQFKTPWAIHTDSSGNLYVTDNNNYRVEKFNSSGTYLGQYGANGTTLGKYSSVDVANIAPDGRMWVSDFNNNNITVYDSSGNPLFQKGGFSNPSGVAFDNNGNTWVSNTGTNEMLKLDSNGNIVFRFGSGGTGNGQFNFAWSMIFDSQNRMWVADRNNNRIQVFTNTGSFLFKFGTAGTGNGQFNYPIDLAIDANNNVWITELNNSRVQEFDSTGAWKKTIGSFGSGNGQFNQCIGIVIK